MDARLFTPQTLPLVEPGKYDTSQNQQLLDQLNELRKQALLAERAEAKRYVEAVVPYRTGQVLDVDVSFLGRKRAYYKGNQRFLIRHIESFFWTDERGKYTHLFINLHGLYVAEDGSMVLPEVVNGMPLSADPGNFHLEKIGLNLSGDNATILGVSTNQFHRYAELQARIDAFEQQQSEMRNNLVTE